MVPVLGFLLYLSRHKYASTGVCFHNQSYSANGSKPGGTFDPVIRSSGESNLEIKVMLLVLVTDVLRTWGEVIICIKLLDSGYDFCSGCGNIHHCYHQQSFFRTPLPDNQTMSSVRLWSPLFTACFHKNCGKKNVGIEVLTTFICGNLEYVILSSQNTVIFYEFKSVMFSCKTLVSIQ